MKRPVYIALLLLLAACGDAGKRAAEDALYGGNAHYNAGRYTEALHAYEPGRADAQVMHNIGAANLRLKAWDMAVPAFREAADRLADTTAQAMAWYHTGNARVMEALAADSLQRAHDKTLRGIRIEGDDVAQKVELYVLRDSLRRELRRLSLLIDSSLTQGIDAYKRSLRLAPTDEDARHNLILTQELVEERPGGGKNKDGGKDGDDKQKELGVRALVIIQQADSLVDAYRFKEALGVLEQGLREDPTLQQRKEYMEKLDLVTKAAEAQ